MRTALLLLLLSLTSYAQEAVIELESDDTLPIAHSRYDDAVVPPKNNFSSVNKNDMWEKFERGELDEKAFVRLQESYQAQANNSKDPYVRRKVAIEQKKAKREKMIAQKKASKSKIAKKSQSSRMPASVKTSKGLPKKKRK